MREQVLFACKPTSNYEVQFGVPLLNCKAAGPWLMQQIRFEGAGVQRAGRPGRTPLPLPKIPLTRTPSGPRCSDPPDAKPALSKSSKVT